MTLGEIQAVIWAKTRTQTEEVTNDDLYEHLKKVRNDNAN